MKLQIGGAVFEVESFRAASAAWEKTRDENGWGASDMPPVTLRQGKNRFRVSYNGRIWMGTIVESLVYDPSARVHTPKEAVNPCTNCGAQATHTLHGEQFCDSCYEHQTEMES
jgi:hypothetical protein